MALALMIAVEWMALYWLIVTGLRNQFVAHQVRLLFNATGGFDEYLPRALICSPWGAFFDFDEFLREFCEIDAIRRGFGALNLYTGSLDRCGEPNE